MSTRTGHCLCGGVQFSARGEPQSVGHCCCRMCQTSVGAVGISWATYPGTGVGISGDTLRWYRSSDKAERGFCSRCGASVAWRKLDGKVIDLTVALFDEPNELPPSFTIWASKKPRWLKLDEHLPQHPTQPKTEDA